MATIYPIEKINNIFATHRFTHIEDGCSKEALMRRINYLVEDMAKIEQRINKITQATIGSETPDFYYNTPAKISSFLKEREEIKSKIMDVVGKLNDKFGLNWDGSRNLNAEIDLFENLNKPIIEKKYE